MKAFVTGGTGIVGANLVRELLRHGYEVSALVRPSSTRESFDGLDVRCVEGDVLDPTTLRGVLDAANLVFHAAANFVYAGRTQEELDRVAVLGTQNVLEAAAAANVERVVVTSSSVVFGSSIDGTARNEGSEFNDPNPSKYALSKQRQHVSTFQLAKKLSLDVVAICPTVTIGRYDFRHCTSSALITSYLNDPFRSTFLGGGNIVSACDVARGHILIAERGKSGEAYILAGENMSWNAFHRAISEQCSLSGPWYTLNHTASLLVAAAAEWNARLTGRTPSTSLDQARMVGRYYWYEHSKAASLGYQPAPAAVAISTAIEWLLNTEFINRFVRESIHCSNSPRSAVTGLQSGVNK